METNKQMLERLGITDYDTIMDMSDGRRCELCDKFCSKNLSPTNPSCEGVCCDEALEYWLEEETGSVEHG